MKKKQTASTAGFALDSLFAIRESLCDRIFFVFSGQTVCVKKHLRRAHV